MQNTSVVLPLSLLGAIAAPLFPRPATAEPTRELSISTPREMLEGDPETASIDPHGQITVGLEIAPLGRASDRAITALIAGPEGTLYAGTAGGEIVRATAKGEIKVLAKERDRVI